MMKVTTAGMAILMSIIAGSSQLYVHGPNAGLITAVTDCALRSETQITTQLHLYPHNRTALRITGTITLHSDLLDSTRITLGADSHPGVVFIKDAPFCTMMNDYIWAFTNVFHANYDRKSCCPIPRGTYIPEDFFFGRNITIDLPADWTTYPKLRLELKADDAILMCKIVDLAAALN